jgi:hypothetical protein
MPKAKTIEVPESHRLDFNMAIFSSNLFFLLTDYNDVLPAFLWLSGNIFYA